MPLSFGPTSRNIVMVHPPNHFQLDFLRTDRFAFTDIGAASKAFHVMLKDHCERAEVPLELALGRTQRN